MQYVPIFDGKYKIKINGMPHDSASLCHFDITVFTRDLKEEVAFINGTAYNENMLSSEEILKHISTDEAGPTECECMEALLHTSIYNKEASAVYDDNKWSGFIDMLYVYKKYRKNGVAKYLLENLHFLLYQYAQIKLRCMISSVEPYDVEKEREAADKTELEDMQHAIRNTLLSSGYSNAYLGSADFYTDRYDSSLLINFFVREYNYQKVVTFDPAKGSSLQVELKPGEEALVRVPEGYKITGLDKKIKIPESTDPKKCN